MLTVNSIRFIKCNVDVSYAIHNDCKGHTGAMMTMGCGALQVSLENKNLIPKVQQKQS